MTHLKSMRKTNLLKLYKGTFHKKGYSYIYCYFCGCPSFLNRTGVMSVYLASLSMRIGVRIISTKITPEKLAMVSHTRHVHLYAI